MSAISAHINEIERVAAGQSCDREPLVVDSWLRCLNDYRLDPSSRGQAHIVTAPVLREHQQQAEELIRISSAALQHLYEQVAGHDYVLLLSDARGVSVAHYRNPKLDPALRQAGLYLGADWAEARAGTCAVGAALVGGAPITVHQDDHFDPAHIALTCSAAPIFDTLGELVAVVDISQLRSATPRSSQQLAHHLVVATARRIELAHLMSRAAGQWVLRVSRSPEFIDSDPEAAIAVDGNGIIQGMTHAAFGALSQRLGLTTQPGRAFIGQPITDLFDLDADMLDAYRRGAAARDRILFAGGQPRLFASAEPPARRVARTRPKPARKAGPHADDDIPASLARIAGDDDRLRCLVHRAARFARRNLTVLIQGETGTGKEVLARAIHEVHDAPGPFVAVNCAAVPEHLIESELFGYAPGAFTGAARNGKRGLIEGAHGGTLFLDEIGDMPLALQSRLLRVLAERCVTPVGALEARPVDIRLISATHAPLAERVASGDFREDLYYRLNAARLELPPLRQRSDLPGLCDALLDQIATEHGETYVLSQPARRRIADHAWPGNIRELRNALAAAAALCDPPTITAEDLPEDVGGLTGPKGLEAQLADCDGNVSALARRLGVDRTTVHRRLKRLRTH
ncbi:sigma-54-dependent Fis family transcriptional regulator [Salinisphaera sp. Q1T1-3]|uniref:sigma-54-dependent Fis family transcriptional regulator n=1 Tax=Salinisphaera sp. Q1T1-3 TaxID=2321229 RepID=UPI000E71BC0A|nr:sigma-54-dependent Fis family transcriptional regulator [Salinisphaera sp. Q1T1-3]RJS93016.1 sigma-54-dependent Fis family transcriptional regulator [Salinisphaera sp. Q1T1-3]